MSDLNNKTNKHTVDKGLDNKKWYNRIEHWMLIMAFLMVYDIIVVNFAYFAALWIRFDFRMNIIDTEYIHNWAYFAPIYALVCIIVFWLLRMYNCIWRFASYNELIRILIGNLIACTFHLIGTKLLFTVNMPKSYYILGPIFQVVLTVGIRFSYRFLLLLKVNRESGSSKTRSNVMIIGAGTSGQMLIRDIRRAEEVTDYVRCAIDDNPNKWGRYVEGVKIVGGRDSIVEAVKNYDIDKIYVAIPSASRSQQKEILDICNETDCKIKILPGMYQLVLGTVSTTDLREVDVEDLLGRDPVKVDLEGILNDLSGKVIMVTGGGGSIGSELCRQIASHSPKQLIIFDIYENNAHEIQLELEDKYPDLNLKVIIGSVRDSMKVDEVFAEYKPDVVYHAAAHKHVPLMEGSPCEAIKNNTIGTYKTAYAAMVNGCKRFVLISTDKAVNPVNIMGASKRLCEMVIQAFSAKIKEGKAREIPPLHIHSEDSEGTMMDVGEMPDKPVTNFVAVRFGNVLGSNGSVIPRFKQQIEEGGPVTVTHPEIIRYFMTIPEAVSLVLQAGSYAKGGEIFVLDMGTPVKIDTLARNMIKLSGLKPDVDIKIEYTGLRPGEKLFEEKLMSEEGMQTTPNELIHIGKPIEFDTDRFFKQVQELMLAAYEGREDIRELVGEVVDTYKWEG